MSALIFQGLIKVIKGSIKTILYGMHLSYIMIRAGCNVSVNPPFQRSKYTCFDKHMFLHIVHMSKSGRNPKQLKPGVHNEPEHDESNRQLKEVPATLKEPAQGPPAPPLLALPNTHSVILDELIHLRQMMMNRFDQIGWRIFDLESTSDAIYAMVEDLRVAQPLTPAL